MIKLLSKLKPKTIACTRNTTNEFRKVAHPKQIQIDFKKIDKKVRTAILSDPSDAFAWSKKQSKTSDIMLDEIFPVSLIQNKDMQPAAKF